MSRSYFFRAMRPRRPKWGHEDVSLLVQGARVGLTLDDLTRAQEGLTRTDIDLALWAKLGRTIPETCDVLNSEATA